MNLIMVGSLCFIPVVIFFILSVIGYQTRAPQRSVVTNDLGERWVRVSGSAFDHFVFAGRRLFVFVTAAFLVVAVGCITKGISNDEANYDRQHGSGYRYEIQVNGSFPDDCVVLVPDPDFPDSWVCTR